MKNQANHLNETLHDQLRRLNDESLPAKNLEREIKRSHAMTTIARRMIENGSVVLEAEQLRHESGALPGRDTPLPEVLSQGATDLHNHLVCQIERLDELPDKPPPRTGDDDYDPLDAEVQRTQAISDVAKQAISNNRLVLRAEQLKRSLAGKPHKFLPPMLNAD